MWSWVTAQEKKKKNTPHVHNHKMFVKNTQTHRLDGKVRALVERGLAALVRVVSHTQHAVAAGGSRCDDSDGVVLLVRLLLPVGVGNDGQHGEVVVGRGVGDRAVGNVQVARIADLCACGWK